MHRVWYDLPISMVYFYAFTYFTTATTYQNMRELLQLQMKLSLDGIDTNVIINFFFSSCEYVFQMVSLLDDVKQWR